MVVGRSEFLREECEHLKLSSNHILRVFVTEEPHCFGGCNLKIADEI